MRRQLHTAHGDNDYERVGDDDMDDREVWICDTDAANDTEHYIMLMGHRYLDLPIDMLTVTDVLSAIELILREREGLPTAPYSSTG